jgi:hypothetical protein
VVIHRADGPVVLSERERLRDCVVDTPDGYPVSCYRASQADEARFLPGDRLELEIRLPDGGQLLGFTVVPSDFRLVDSPASRICMLPEGRTLEVRWTSSPGAWAYVSETAVQDFREALQAAGYPVQQDRIHLVGVSISQSDTTIVFPIEFGLFERLSEDQGIMVALQRGLPAGALAQITVAAADRNLANWLRGGTFNPSGQVRVPSLRGDGTGFFGASVVRTLTVWAPPRDIGLPQVSPDRVPEHEHPAPHLLGYRAPDRGPQSAGRRDCDLVSVLQGLGLRELSTPACAIERGGSGLLPGLLQSRHRRRSARNPVRLLDQVRGVLCKDAEAQGEVSHFPDEDRRRPFDTDQTGQLAYPAGGPEPCNERVAGLGGGECRLGLHPFARAVPSAGYDEAPGPSLTVAAEYDQFFPVEQIRQPPRLLGHQINR